MDKVMFAGRHYIDDAGNELPPERITTSYQQGGRNVTAVITPQVAASVKALLGCGDLIGAELEDDGGNGAMGSHWEQRLFEGGCRLPVVCHFAPHPRKSVAIRLATLCCIGIRLLCACLAMTISVEKCSAGEIMNAVLGRSTNAGKHVLTALTLSLLEDSGWCVFHCRHCFLHGTVP
jgi:hypothetical protein